MVCKTLGLFVNIMTADNKYSALNRQSLTQSIQMQLSRNLKNFGLFFFLHFWNVHQILNMLKKKFTFIAYVFRYYGLQKTWLNKCLKSPVSENSSTSNVVNVPKDCWNLGDSAFNIFIDHYEENLVLKCLS